MFHQGTCYYPRTWLRGAETTPTPPASLCFLHLCILKPRFPLLNFSQVKYSIGLLESKVLHLTD